MDQTDYRKKLDEYLLNKLKEQNDPNYGAEDREEMASVRDSDRRNALAASLMKSANQFGAIGGKVADSSPVDDMAQRMAGVNKQRLAEIGDRRAQADKQFGINADVYKYLAEKQNQQERFAKEDKFRAETLAQNKAKAAADEKRQRERDAVDQANKDREFGLKERELAAKKEKDAQALAEKTKNPKQDVELNTRVNNINSNIDKLKSVIGKVGTFEVFGPESDTMDQIIQDIAVDYAKMVDPDSVARESEVEAAKKMLNVKGLGVRNSTALASLDEFRDQLETRINSRRVAQGLEPLAKTKKIGGDGEAIANDKAPPTTPDEDAMALEWARKNPDHPMAKDILKANGVQ